MYEKALEIASRITHPVALAAFAIAVLAIVIGSLRRRKPEVARILAFVILVLGLTPLITSTILQSRGIYRVRAIVLGKDNLPITDAHVSSSTGGEPKKVESGWEFDIPPQTQPADHKVTFYASAPNAFLAGSYTLVLSEDYYPTVTIKVTTDTSATLRGVVVDEYGRSVADATVSIVGNPDFARTDNTGNFVLPANASEGQVVQVRAQKGQLTASISAQAGHVPVKLVLKQP